LRILQKGEPALPACVDPSRFGRRRPGDPIVKKPGPTILVENKSQSRYSGTMAVPVKPDRAGPGSHSRFTETSTWEPLGDGWNPLFGNFSDLGFSIEWHDFTARQTFDWSPSFHPRGLEICLNLAGRGEVQSGRRSLELSPATAGFYAQNDPCLRGTRRGGERHQFVTVELSLNFLQQHFTPGETGLHTRVNDLLRPSTADRATVSDPVRISSQDWQTVMALRNPPVPAAAHRLWYQAKALEIAATLLYRPSEDEELFCQRHQRANRERVQKVLDLLSENLLEPLPLEELGRRVGCSHFYLSRIFTQEMGKTISAHLRDLRMERAAQLLREGKMNVTEVAFAVGYSSQSHFSTAFHQAFGCCAGLYPLATPPQVLARRSRPAPAGL
jgi:AraC-like DNA-binding protein